MRNLHISTVYRRNQKMGDLSFCQSDLSLIVECDDDVPSKVSEAHVVEPVNVDMAFAQRRYGSSAVSLFPGLTVSPKVLIGNPNYVHPVDAGSRRCHGEGCVFDLILISGVPAPE